MYAAAGGASLASRRHKPKHRNTADADALIHRQFQRRFEQHQQQYAPASGEHHHLRAVATSSSLTSSTPAQSPFGQVRLPGTAAFDPTENKTATAASVAWPAPIGPSPDSDGTAQDGSILIHLPADPHRKWTKKNKIHDALAFGGDGCADRRLYELQQGAAANTLLYVGLCSVALGLIIAFVGTGEKGFKTVQLRFIGPGMIAIGACCCVVRIMLCFCPPAFCFKRRRHKGDKMAEFYKYMPFRNHPMSAAAGTEALRAVVEVVPMTVLKPALKRATPTSTTIDRQQSQRSETMPKATPEASLDSSMEHLIERDDHLYTKDEVTSNRNLSNLKSTLTFEDSLNAVTKMMVKSFEELNTGHATTTSSCEPGSSTSTDRGPQELVLSAVNLHAE